MAGRLRMVQWAWIERLGCEPSIKPSAKAVAMALASTMNSTGATYPSIETLHNKTGQSERTVQRSITELVEAGWLKADRGGGRGRASYYIAVIPERSAGTTPIAAVEPVEQDPAHEAWNEILAATAEQRQPDLDETAALALEIIGGHQQLASLPVIERMRLRVVFVEELRRANAPPQAGAG